MELHPQLLEKNGEYDAETRSLKDVRREMGIIIALPDSQRHHESLWILPPTRLERVTYCIMAKWCKSDVGRGSGHRGCS
jgi:hypothetical protein